MGDVVEIVDRSVERINYPTHIRILPAADAFFAEDGVAGVIGQNNASDGLLSLNIHFQFDVMSSDLVDVEG